MCEDVPQSSCKCSSGSQEIPTCSCQLKKCLEQGRELLENSVQYGGSHSQRSDESRGFLWVLLFLPTGKVDRVIVSQLL